MKRMLRQTINHSFENKFANPTFGCLAKIGSCKIFLYFTIGFSIFLGFSKGFLNKMLPGCSQVNRNFCSRFAHFFVPQTWEPDPVEPPSIVRPNLDTKSTVDINSTLLWYSPYTELFRLISYNGLKFKRIYRKVAVTDTLIRWWGPKRMFRIATFYDIRWSESGVDTT